MTANGGGSSLGRFFSGTAGRWLLRALRLVLGGLLIYAAYSKLRWSGQWHLGDYQFIFAIVIDSYKMLPLSVIPMLARIVPPLEIVLGVLLILGLALRWVGLATIGLLLVYMAALSHAVILRLEICGCYGDKAVNPKTELMNDAGLLLIALLITVAAFLAHRESRGRAAAQA